MRRWNLVEQGASVVKVVGMNSWALQWFTLCMAFLGLNVWMPVQASERWVVLVAVDRPGSSTDLDDDHPIWQEVESAVAEALVPRTESNATLSAYTSRSLGCNSSQCRNKTPNQWARWALQQNRGINLVVAVRLHADANTIAMKRWRVEIIADMIDPESEDLFDQARTPGHVEFVDESQSRDERGQRNWLASRVAREGREIGTIIFDKLGPDRRFVYRIRAENLALGEHELLQSSLPLEAGVQTTYPYQELLHQRVTKEYGLTTDMGALQLERLLNELLAGGAFVTRESREIIIRRHGMPYLGRYAGGGLLVLASVVALWMMYVYRRHEAALAQANSPREALAYLEQVSGRGLPWLPRWRVRATGWKHSVDKVNALLARVQRHMDEDAFEEAADELAEAAMLEPRHPQVVVLAEALPRQRRAVDLVAQARAQLTSEPAAAAHVLAEAMSLDPTRKRELQTLMDTLQGVLRIGAVKQAEQQAQDAMAEGQPYTALRAVGQGIAAIRGLDGMATELAVLRRLADQARAMIVPLRGPARGTGLLDRMLFVVGDSVEIGRGSAADVGAVGVGYKRASRIGKQTRLQRDRAGLLVEDIGSTNGTQVDGQLLPANKPVRLQGEYDISLGGNRETGAAGACRFKLRVFPGEAASAALACDPAPLRLLDSAQLAEVWPSRREDLGNVWLALAGPVPLALGEALRPAHEGESAVIAVGYDEGYYVAPIDEASPSGVRIEGELITTRTPLSATAQLSIDGRPFGLAPW